MWLVVLVGHRVVNYDSILTLVFCCVDSLFVLLEGNTLKELHADLDYISKVLTANHPKGIIIFERDYLILKAFLYRRKMRACWVQELYTPPLLMMEEWVEPMEESHRGISLRRRDKPASVRLPLQRALESIVHCQDPTKARQAGINALAKSLDEILDPNAPHEMFRKTIKLNETYTNPIAAIAPQVAARIERARACPKDPLMVDPPMVGSRMPYMVCTRVPGAINNATRCIPLSEFDHIPGRFNIDIADYIDKSRKRVVESFSFLELEREATRLYSHALTLGKNRDTFHIMGSDTLSVTELAATFDISREPLNDVARRYRQKVHRKGTKQLTLSQMFKRPKKTMKVGN
jgi:predicted DNA-binding protein YlxM (UPF0122 family)